MRTFGLVGKSLSHSFSQQYFTEKFTQEGVCNAEYLLFSLEKIEEIKELLKHPTLLGFNVTIPYKSAIIPFLDELDPVAQEIGSVNCVIKQNGQWMGYNTDVVGVEETLRKAEGRREKGEGRKEKGEGRREKGIRRSALVLGSGGASKSVCYVLKQRNIPFQIVSRNKTEKTITYNDLTEEIINHYTLIINTTPLGMYPNINEKPQIPYSALHSKHILIDLIYNPDETLFLKEGKKRGTFTINGLTMFMAQAEASWKHFSSPNIF
jgi:shikimate dehydrogenase